MPSLQEAVEQLYSNSALTGDLNDEEAQTLLDWGRTQLEKLSAAGLSEAAFEQQFSALRSLLMHINSLIGFREYATPEQQAADLARIQEKAAALGLRTDWLGQMVSDAVDAQTVGAEAPTFAQAAAAATQPALDKLTAIREMTRRLEKTSAQGAEAAAQTTAAQTEAEQTADTAEQTAQQAAAQQAAEAALKNTLDAMKQMIDKLQDSADESGRDA